MLEKKDKILIAGAHGMVGSALVRCLNSQGFTQLLVPTRQELDFSDQRAVREFMQSQKPSVVVIAAAKVGGIWANMTYPAEFIYSNLMIACNIIHEAHGAGIDRLLYLGSSCIYPANTANPIVEEALLTGPLEKSNEAYALAKIAGVKMCEFYRIQYGRRYISAMPTNLYGPKDTYHPENSHVIPSLIRRFHTAKIAGQDEVKIWGTGSARREFLYVDDLANGCVYLLKYYDDKVQINIGSEDEVTILQLAELIAETVGFTGKITPDPSKPEGVVRKKIDTRRIISLGWKPVVALKEGLRKSYSDFLSCHHLNVS